MDVNIKTFRRISNSKFHFEDNKITLITGCSGIGKTTILEAITWCIYGSIRDVDDPVGKKKAKVIIYIDGYKIIRSKIKCVSIEVEYKDKRYKSKEAESIIEDIFGPKSLWYTSCYLQQDERIPFLYSNSNKSKLQILNSIAFTDTDPNKEIDLCNQKIVTITSLRDKQMAKYDKSKEKYSKFKKHLDDIVECTKEDLDKAIESKNKLLLDVKNLKKLKEVNNKNKIKADLLSKEVTKLETRISKLKETLISIPDGLGNIDSLIKYRKLDNKITLNTEALNKIPKYNETFTSKYLYDVEEREKIIADNISLCNDLNISYDEDSIKNANDFYNNSCKLRDLQQKIKEKIAIINYLSKYDDVGESDLIDTVNREKQILANKKILSTYKILYNKDTIQENINYITELLNYQDIIDKIKERQDIIDKINSIPEIKVSDVVFTNDDLIESLEKERIIKENVSLANKIPVPYTEKDVIDTQKKLRNILDKQDAITYYNDRKKILDKINSLGEVEENVNKFTKQDLLDTIRLEKEVELLKNKHEELGISYSPNSAKEEASRLEEILKYQDLLVQRSARNKILDKLNTLVVPEPPEHNFTYQDLDNIDEREQDYETNSTLYAKYSIPYTQENVNYITKNYSTIKLYNKRCMYSYCTKEEYEKQKNKLKRLQDGLKCISCPNCKTSLVHQNGELKKSLVGISSKEEVNECKLIVDKMEKYINLSHGIPDSFVMKDFAKNLSNKDLELLSESKYVEKPEFTSKYIKKQIEIGTKYNNVIKERQVYENKLAKTPEVIIEVEVPKLTLLERKNYSNKLSVLNNLEYISPPEYSSSYIDKQISNERKYNLKQKYEEKLKEIPVVDSETILDVKKLTVSEKKDIESKLNMLSNIKVIESPEYSSNFIKSEIENRKEYEKNNKLLQSYKSKLSKLPEIEVPTNIKLVKLSVRDKEKYKNKLASLKSIQWVDEPKYTSDVIRSIIDNKNKLKGYKDVPDSIDKEVNFDELDKLSKIKLVKYVEKDKYTSDYIKEVIKTNNERDIINKLIEESTNKINLIEDKTDLSLEELLVIKTNIEKNIITNSSINSDSKNLDKIKEDLSKIVIDDKLDDLIEETEENISKLDVTIKNYKNYIKLSYLKEKYKRYENDVNNTNLDLKSANNVLKEALISSQKEVLNNIIVNINNTIKPIIKKLFTDPIHISFSLMKTLKNGKEKDCLSVCIRFKAVEYDNISKFSGGEKARINIAFLLTIAKILNVRLILFDEPCKSIEEDLVEKCVKVIKSTLPAIKICIAHKEIEAKYDNTIVLE